MSEKIWINGKYFNKDDKIIKVSLNAIHYGTSVFEGILCPGAKQPLILQLNEHIERFFSSASLLDFCLPYSKEALIDIIKEVVRHNGKGSFYIRPIAFKDSTYLDLTARNRKISVAVLCKKFPFQLFLLQMKKRIKVMISKKVKNHWGEYLAGGKLSGKYLISAVAKLEAEKNGFDDAILLDNRNMVSEATTANIFIVRDGLIKTPSLNYTLNGITQKSIMEIADGLGYKVSQVDINVDELYDADEVFLTSTARGIVSVSQVNDQVIGRNKNITSELRNIYIDILKNKNIKYRHWLTPL